MLRLFVCIWIPDHIKKNIQKLQERMIKLPMKAKFIEAENLHITITFLGDVEDGKLKLLIEKLNALTKKAKKFPVKLENMKFIPNEKYIRVIGIEVMGEKTFTDFIKCLGISLGGKYHESTKLTLCRVKNILNKGMIKNFIEKNRNVKIGEFQVGGVSLVKSMLTSHGPVYETLHTSVLR